MGFTGDVPRGDTIPNSYIVVLKPTISEEEAASHIESIHSQPNDEVGVPSQTAVESFSIQLSESTTSGETPPAFRGYTGTFSSTVLQSIKESPLVDYVQPNQYIRVQDVQPAPPSWGLSRISHRGPFNPGDNNYVYDNNESGQGVTAYVVDTGIRMDHQDFGGRAIWGKTIPSGASNTDTVGHGTHVAGTLAGTKYGVAKKAKVIAVKVFPDNASSTPTSNIIQGIEWAVKDAQDRRNINSTVMNLSLGGLAGPNDKAMEQAVEAAVKAGMIVAVAAGNWGRDIKDYTPARAPNALTVGAIDRGDSMPQWSNWGQLLDLNGPGVDIVSCGIASPSATATMSGTSMATPHIAGLVCGLRQGLRNATLPSLAYELRLRAEGRCKVYPGHEAGTANLAAVNVKVPSP